MINKIPVIIHKILTMPTTMLMGKQEELLAEWPCQRHAPASKLFSVYVCERYDHSLRIILGIKKFTEKCQKNHREIQPPLVAGIITNKKSSPRKVQPPFVAGIIIKKVH